VANIAIPILEPPSGASDTGDNAKRSAHCVTSLENAERLDMIAKTMRFADECRQQAEQESGKSTFNTLFWKAMQTALNLAS